MVIFGYHCTFFPVCVGAWRPDYTDDSPRRFSWCDTSFLSRNFSCLVTLGPRDFSLLLIHDRCQLACPSLLHSVADRFFPSVPHPGSWVYLFSFPLPVYGRIKLGFRGPLLCQRQWRTSTVILPWCPVVAHSHGRSVTGAPFCFNPRSGAITWVPVQCLPYYVLTALTWA